MQDTNDKRDKMEERRKGLDERKSEATSDETLSDLEDSETDSGSSSIKSDPGPSPDGALDESDEIKDAGPM
jgi:hypothetical protein